MINNHHIDILMWEIQCLLVIFLKVPYGCQQQSQTDAVHYCLKVKVLEGGMIWRKHQDHLRQRSVIDSEATCVIAPTVSTPHYPDLLFPDDSTDQDSQTIETEESRPVEHPPPRRNPKRRRTQPRGMLLKERGNVMT